MSEYPFRAYRKNYLPSFATIKSVYAPPDQQGQYIIKITPAYRLKNRTQLAANEHLSMQIAQQVYGIKTAANAMVFMNDGEQAFITKRFDRCSDGRKIKQEDFASLSQKTAINHGTDYKYTGNYQDIAHLIRLHASDATNLECFYQLILFNYLFANGDAHLKNFSLQWTDSGVVLSPAYDLLNTSLHVNDTDFALQAGLGLGLAQSAIYDRTGHPCVTDFSAFAAAIGLSESQIIKVNKPFISQQARVSELIQASFLTNQLKRMYYRSYQERLSRLIRN